MAKKDQVDTLEYGDVYFLYRPRVEQEEPEGLQDVQNLYMVLSPHGKKSYRLAIIGRERLPKPSKRGRERFWGFVSMVSKDPKEVVDELGGEIYRTKTRGERHRPAARPAGEGVYVILRHGDHTHLAYALELPKKPGEVQEAFNIRQEASYIVSVRNPDTPAPPRAGLPREQEAEYPRKLRERFRGRRFAELDPPDFLDHEGAEFLLVAAAQDVGAELGIDLEPEREDASRADIFRDLGLRKSEHPTKPLFEGKWD